MLAVPACILAAVALIYGNSLDAPFNYDDEATIKNDIVFGGDRFFDWHPLHYRHLFFLTLAANHALSGLDPFGYHVFNVVVHAFSAVLLLAIAFFTLERGLAWERRPAFTVAALTALIFALHPVHTEAVTYISGRASSLSGFFFLLSLLCFIAGSVKEAGAWRRFGLYALSLAGFLAALLSKETSAVLPLVLCLYDVCFLRGERFKPFRQRLHCFYLPVLLAGAAAFVLSPELLAQLGQWLPRIDLSYAGMQTVVVAYAFKLFFWPVNLSFDHDFTPGFFSAGAFFMTGAAALLLAMHAGLTERPRARRLILFCLLWFIITLAPTNSLLPRPDLLSERNLYLPAAGLSLLLAVWLHGLFFTRRGAAPGFRRAAGTVCVAVLLVSFTALLVHRNGVYASNVTLWEDTLKKSPGKPRALHNLSHFYLRDKRYDEALVTLERLAASNASPFYRSFAHNNLGSLHTHFGNPAQAEKEFQAAIASDPTIPTGYFNLASLYASRERYAEARTQYALAEERYTMYRWGYPKPAELAVNRAKVNLKLGLLQEAETILNGLLKTVPDSGDGLMLLGDLLQATGRRDAAIRTYQKIARPPETKSRARNNLGILWIEQGETERALAAFKEAAALDPKLADAHFNLGTLLMQTEGDLKKARTHLETALTLIRDPQKHNAVRMQLKKLGANAPGGER